MSNALKIQEQQPTALAREEFFTPEQLKIIRDSFLSGASESEARVLIELAKARGLNPITGQIHFVQRWNGKLKRMTWAAQVGIDGFRAIAERTGKYEGQDEPEFETDKAGRPIFCRVKVYRKDWSRPAVGVAHFAEYVQKTSEGAVTHMWATKPFVMLAKCAEALALRKAFPDNIGGLYTPDEAQDNVDEAAPVDTAKTVASSDARIGEALKRKSAASVTVDSVAVAAPRPSPRRIEIKDVPPDEDDGHAESLAQMEVGR